MWAVARLRSASATVELMFDVAADARPFLLPLPEAAALARSALNFSNVEPSMPAFGCALLLMGLPCVLAKWPG